MSHLHRSTMATQAAYPHIDTASADDSFFALALEAEVSEPALQWLIGHNVRKIKDLAKCAPSEQLLWERVLVPMRLPPDDLAASARVVEMWVLARARRDLEAGSAAPGFTGGPSAPNFDVIPRMSGEERALQKERWCAHGDPLPDDEEFPEDRTWDAFQDDHRKKTLKVFELERILTRSSTGRLRRFDAEDSQGYIRSRTEDLSEIKGLRTLMSRIRTMMNTYVLIGRVSKDIALRYARKIEKLATGDPRPDLQLLIAADLRIRRYWRREVIDKGVPLVEAIEASIERRPDIWTEEVINPAQWAAMRKEVQRSNRHEPKPEAQRSHRRRSRERSPRRRPDQALVSKAGGPQSLSPLL